MTNKLRGTNTGQPTRARRATSAPATNTGPTPIVAAPSDEATTAKAWRTVAKFHERDARQAHRQTAERDQRIEAARRIIDEASLPPGIRTELLAALAGTDTATATGQQLLP